MTTRDTAQIALFAALFAVLGLMPAIALPVLPVPITMQSMGAMLAGAILGPRRGALAVVLFVVLVAAGFPLLAGGRGGLAVFAGPTAGYIVGWCAGAATTGWLVQRMWQRLNLGRAILATAIGGILVVYAIGVPWMAAIAGLPLGKAILGSAVFLPGDLIKATLAASVAVTVKRGYPLIRPV
ncbi:MAG: biotin transporter BioY [Azospirillaceae bacterium]|nr:biotin transporter BioY [Azospirillaceae bacterium]